MNLLLSLLIMLSPQQKHVSWTFNALQVQPGIYTVHAQVFIDSGWILFSQHEKNEKYTATSFAFESNPLIKVMKIQEGGVIYKDSCYRAFTGYADFEMKIVVKNRGTTTLRGNVMYEPFDPSAPERSDRWILEDPFEIKLD